MEAYKKIYSISIFWTSIIAYLIWEFANSISLTFVENVLINKIIIISFNFIFAYGFFSSLSGIIVKLSEKVHFIKKIILGEAYMEGIWGGYYFAKDGVPVICIEYITQTLENTYIIGEGYFLNMQYKGTWSSIGQVEINKSQNELRYIYTTDMIDETLSNIGIGFFLIKKEGLLKYPQSIRGYTLNVDCPYKGLTVEKKIAELNSKISVEEIISECLKMYRNSLKVEEEEV